ncbi:30S ribosomal protein S16 [Cellulosispirillum alkaliphilum]|uniref:30S ribosomal protein S16 n=1 Tax=Cellulosispirillum alkaliphilum TaxID=3039283 RepID=UPI003D6DC930
MPVKIRLARVGRKKVAKYRVVAADSRMRRDGRFLETIGSYDPTIHPKAFEFKTERVAYWLKQGAEPSETVANLLKQDRFYEKMEGLEKGLSPDELNIERKPERKRKAKPQKEKSDS